MSIHAAILPILIPFVTALLQLMGKRFDIAYQRSLGLIGALLGVFAAIWLMLLADEGAVLVYALGNWSAPFGIVLVADRLAAGMTLITAVLAGAALLYATAGFDNQGRHFHPLFQLQIVGLQGAFLTGDLFNLFVFFEIMLLASYVLLAHGGGLARTRAGLAYVTLNLVGSAVFLIALAMLYSSLGTLNLADVALRLQTLQGDIAPARLAVALMISVFALKAALLPLSFWLPHTYAAAGAPVAALFVIMTKVGIVCIWRVQAIALAPAAATADMLDNWLVPVALATVLFAAMGALAATRLQNLAAWLVLGSAGTLMVVPAYPHSVVTAAAMYYLVHSTFVVAALFMLSELIAERRGTVADRFQAGPPFNTMWLLLVFLVVGASAIGLPPFSGFLGKLMLLSALRDSALAMEIWTVLLVCGFLVLLALVKGGCRLLWKQKFGSETELATVTTTDWRRGTALLLMASFSLLMVLLARPISDYASRAAIQLHTPETYITAVLGSNSAAIEREQRP